MGFLFFGKRNGSQGTIPGADIFYGFTDWHSHILPGVDDGVQTMEDSLAVLEQYEQWGVKAVWLTPHIMEDCPNSTAALRARFEELKAAYAENRQQREAAREAAGEATGDAASNVSREAITLNLAAENMLDGLFEERLAAGDLLPITAKGDHLLVETSYYNPPMNLYGILEEIFQKGYQPILAHPERYVYMSMHDYERLKQMGVKFQMNLFSQADRYGREVRKKVNALLDRHYYSYAGSDLHRLSVLAEVPDMKFRNI